MYDTKAFIYLFVAQKPSHSRFASISSFASNLGYSVLFSRSGRFLPMKRQYQASACAWPITCALAFRCSLASRFAFNVDGSRRVGPDLGGGAPLVAPATSTSTRS